MKIALAMLPAWGIENPNYTLAVLSAALKKSGYEPKVFDFNIDFYNAVSLKDQKNWIGEFSGFWFDEDNIDTFIQTNWSLIDDAIQHILNEAVNVIGFSVNGASRIMTLKINRLLKKINPNIITVLGGPECFRSEYGLGFMQEQEIDAICTGEGDYVLGKLMECINRGQFGKEKVKGFVTRDRETGIVLDGGDPDAVVNLNALPFPDYDSLDLEKYQKDRLSIMTSRGCINRCAFCSEGTNFKKYRFRTAENIVDELRYQMKYFVHSKESVFITFNDSLINGNIKELERMCDLIIREGIKVSWSGMALIRSEMTMELFGKMKKAGCTGLFWGIESGSDDVLRLMRKKFNVETCEQVLRDCYLAGIQSSTNIIIGFPGETEKNYIETCLFIKRNLKYLYYIGLPYMIIRKNSVVYEEWERFNILDRDTGEQFQTGDGSNTFELRSMKRELLSNIVSDKIHRQGKHDMESAGKLATDESVHYEKLFNKVLGLEGVSLKPLLAMRSNLIYLKRNCTEKRHNYLIWGTGNSGRTTKKVINEILPNFNLIGYIDTFKNGMLEGKNIFMPEDIEILKFSYIFVSTSPGKSEVQEYLESLGLKYEKDYAFGYGV
ncbi:MAG: B12-binding domain-containing radical SAM protein [Clostridia bacterium]|nr:B12-binding domain-containing radical SAM protein [Clostridia bacterium]